MFFNRKKGMGNKEYILLLNNVISILDLLKILTCYIDKKILEIRNKNILTKTIIFQSFAK